MIDILFSQFFFPVRHMLYAYHKFNYILNHYKSVSLYFFGMKEKVFVIGMLMLLIKRHVKTKKLQVLIFGYRLESKNTEILAYL